MAIDLKDFASRAITLGVEGALSTAKRLERVSRGVSGVYNMLADALPIPLPRLGSERSAYNPPVYQYEAPSRAPATTHTPPMPTDSPKTPTIDLNIVEVKASPKPAPAKKTSAKKATTKKATAKKPAAKKATAKKPAAKKTTAKKPAAKKVTAKKPAAKKATAKKPAAKKATAKK
jgi:hypothetical protein